jgi:putative toxin-antitoxin system antitoxin component (TIGR02293 family)
MTAKQLADAYEKLKELRRKGGPADGMQSRIGRRLRYDLADSGIPERLRELVQRLYAQSEGDAAKSDDSADLIRALEIQTLADRVFGGEEKAEAWLQRPNRALSGQKPADLLKDELGVAVVRELLERIDHGIFA